MTDKGKETLKLLLEKHQLIRNSMESLKIAMIGNEEEFHDEKLSMHHPFHFLFENFNKKSDQEKIEFLENQEFHLSRKIKIMEKELKRINKLLLELKKKKNE